MIQPQQLLPKYPYWFGIDPGTKTGLAIWESKGKRFQKILTVPIHQALELVGSWAISYKSLMFIRVEDPRKATFWREEKDKAKLQGAGSIKRDASIWEDFLTDIDIPFEMVRPNKAITKLADAPFRRMTGWDKPTSNHARDAAMLVFGK